MTAPPLADPTTVDALVAEVSRLVTQLETHAEALRLKGAEETSYWTFTVDGRTLDAHPFAAGTSAALAGDKSITDRLNALADAFFYAEQERDLWATLTAPQRRARIRELLEEED